ncbi:unnamed protein product [Protopolystoma xenopodis]|uniref:Secreted protein n=1 Tax=Protopolystoma xenopodis TaxID=117903 RepID=A0A448X4P0_9PLAT|nr:unnamed protein product [Protopolystoma xenopodis]
MVRLIVVLFIIKEVECLKMLYASKVLLSDGAQLGSPPRYLQRDLKSDRAHQLQVLPLRDSAAAVAGSKNGTFKGKCYARNW